MNRRVLELAGLLTGGLTAALGQAIHVPMGVAMGLACAAAFAVGMMFRGRRIMGIAICLLAVAGMVAAASQGGKAWWLWLGFIPVAVLGAAWIPSRSDATTQREQSLWAQQDAGIDVTDDMPETAD